MGCRHPKLEIRGSGEGGVGCGHPDLQIRGSGGGGCGHPDLEISGGRPVSPKFLFGLSELSSFHSA